MRGFAFYRGLFLGDLQPPAQAKGMGRVQSGVS